MSIRVFLAFLCLAAPAVAQAPSQNVAQAPIQVADLFTSNQFTHASFQPILPANQGFVTASISTKAKIEQEKSAFPLTAEPFLKAEGNATLTLNKDKNGYSLDFTAEGKDEAAQACLKDLTPKGLTQLAPVSNFTNRYYVKLNNCDTFFDIQDDSVKVLSNSCKIATCDLELNGLYRNASSLPIDDKILDREWRDADKRFNKARASLTKKLGQTQAMRDFLSEHLDFMSQRLTHCEAFGKEASWCSLRLTQIRAVELEHRLTALK